VAQRLAVALTEARGFTPGVPLRSEKVTREE
jgi:fructoselysine-6-P-deglycase FrlB-like protein